MHAVTLKKLEDLETTRERCARVCYVGSWPCLSSHMQERKTAFGEMKMNLIHSGEKACHYFRNLLT